MAHHDAAASACHDVHVVSQWLIYMGIDTPNQLCMVFFFFISLARELVNIASLSLF
jgi:hypothetical protein